jgi:hypothetical protein
MEDENPSTQDLANLSEDAYQSKPMSPEMPYTRISDLSSQDISTYKHNEKPFYVVSHRGTDLSGDGKKSQLKADLNILRGEQAQDTLHRKRAKQTEDIIRGIKERDPDHKIHLTAHSLGGSTIQNAMLKKAYVRDNVDSVNTFNSGTSPFNKVKLNPNSKIYKGIANKSTHHVVVGDTISENAKSSMIGKIKKYNIKTAPTLSRKLLNYTKLFSYLNPATALVHWGADRLQSTLQAHTIKNFTK